MSDDSDKGSKSEKATPKRMRELRRDGSLQRSQDLAAWLVVGSGALILPVVINNANDAAREHFGTLLEVAKSPDPRAALEVTIEALTSMFGTMAPLFAVVVVAAVVAAATQGGLYLAPKRLKPSAKHLHPKQGFKRVFGPEAWWNGAKAALKATAIGTVLYMVVQSAVPVLLGTGAHSLSKVLDEAAAGATSLLRVAVIAGLILAGLDVMVVIKRNRKKTRMSMKEIKDEHKQTEGDPWLKGQIRSRQMAMSRNRMMAEMANADVVMVNPTHVAVALRYIPGTGAPRVVAKGRGNIATRIREVAADNRIPMVQDVPLARALHDACELGQEIPPHLFAAVARVLAFIVSLRQRGAAAGMHRDPQAEPVAA